MASSPALADGGADVAGRRLTPEDLEPRFALVGPEGKVPTELVVEFARPVFSPEQVGQPASGRTSLTFSPPLSRELKVRGPSTLLVSLGSPSLDTEYVATLESVETSDGVLRAPPSAAGAWAHRFRTPPLSFIRLALLSSDTRNKTVMVQLQFSSAVELESVRRAAVWHVDGSPIGSAKLRYADNTRDALIAELVDPRLRAGATVRLLLRGRANVPSGEATVVLKESRRLDVTRVTLREGATGFYVDVWCRELEPAAPPSFQWDGAESDGYDPGYDYRNTSGTPCQLDADTLEAFVSIEPKVKVTVASGRNGVQLFGDFKRGEHTLALKSGLSSPSGAVLLADHVKRLTVPARSPFLSLGATGRYLPRSAWKNLAVSHRNVDRAELTIRRVPPENLIYWLSDTSSEGASERVADLVHRSTLAFESPPDGDRTTYVDVSSVLPSSTRGVLEVSVHAGRAAASSRLLLTDLSVIAKRAVSGGTDGGHRESVAVWVLDIATNRPVPGVEVALVKKSGRRVASCTTTSDGCRLDAPPDSVDPSVPFALVARKGEELTYVRYQDLKTDLAEADVHGEPFGADRPYRAALWLDRGVYRPGDVAHLALAVRKQDGGAAPGALPLELSVMDPRGRLARKLRLQTNEVGLVQTDLAFEAFADTGSYRLVAQIADREVGTLELKVEEFVPERMKVSATTDRAAYGLGAVAQVSVGAAYLFGGSASESPVEVTCTLEPSVFKPAQNAQLSYGLSHESGSLPRPTALGQVKGVLDERGEAKLSCPPVDESLRSAGRLRAQAAVFESGSGRSTVAEAVAPVHPEAFYIGLGASAERAKVGQPFTVRGALVDWSGAIVETSGVEQLDVEYARLEDELGFWRDDEEGTEQQRRHLRPVGEGRVKVKVERGRFEFQVTPERDASRYLVRARARRAETELVLEGEGTRWWWWGEGGAESEQTPRPQRATRIAMTGPKAAKVGEPFQVTATIPWRGRALFTVETDAVVHSEWRDVEAGPQAFTHTLRSFTPNVYASVLVVKDPRLESADSFLPDRAFGVLGLPLTPTANVQQVRVKVPAEVRSASELEVELALEAEDGPTYATVAAVDEGILQLTRFVSPDPLADVFVKRALGIETYETIGWTLLSVPQGPSKRTGGDEPTGAPGRVQPVKPVALFSGPVKVEGGRATVKLSVPQYRGQLRVMVVTVGPRRIGRASAAVRVADPLVVQTTLPRFLTYLDTVQIPVFLTNTSKKTMTAEVALDTQNLPVPGLAATAVEDSPLQLLGKASGRATLPSGGSATLVFQARAQKSVGAARLTVTVRSEGFQTRDTLDVPFYPTGPRERVVKKLELEEGELDLKPHLAGFVPTTEQSTVWVTSNPYGTVFSHLKHLIQYPYGCIEQTTSSTRPMLFVSGLLEAADPTVLPPGAVDERIMAGVRRLLSMQTPSGGFSYWPGNTEPVAWGTAYALHLLLDAKKLGYDVPKERLDDALRWVGEELDRYERGQANRTGYYEDHGGDAEPYLHYVLALAGKGRKAAIAKVLEGLPKGTKDGVQLERRYQLQAALYLAGDRRHERELKSPDVSSVSEERRNTWSFYSDRRRRGLMLSVFGELFGADEAGEPLAQLVASALSERSSGWYTTQELVWGVTGLGRRVGNVAATFSPPVLTAGGKVIQSTASKHHGGERSWALARASEYPTLSLKLDRRGGGKAWAILTSQGVRERATWRVGGEGLKVTRRFLDLSGRPIELGEEGTTLASMLFVELTVTNEGPERVQNLALVDRLPAGFEVENARLGRGTSVEWLDPEQQWKADYLNLRDDRIEVFGAIEARSSRKVVYAVRAVTAGTFTLPPVEVEAMYDPRLWAREAGGQIEVSGPWADFLL